MTDQERIIELRQAGLAIPAIAAVLNVSPEAVEAVEVGGGSLPGGSSAPTSELVFGTDIPLLNSWTTPGPGENDLPGRVYVQGGRAYMAGYAIAPADSTLPICVIPPAVALLLMGAAGDDDGQRRFDVVKNAASPAVAVFAYVGSDFTFQKVTQQDGSAITAGDYVNLAAIHWPIAV